MNSVCPLCLCTSQQRLRAPDYHCLCALQQLQAVAVTSALYERQALNVSLEETAAEQSRAEQGGQLDKDKCSMVTSSTPVRDSGAAPRKQLLCYQSHSHHTLKRGSQAAGVSLFMASRRFFLHNQIYQSK